MRMAGLADLGWDDAWATAFEAVAREGETPGRVVLEHNHVYRVLTPDPSKTTSGVVFGKTTPDVVSGAATTVAAPSESAGSELAEKTTSGVVSGKTTPDVVSEVLAELAGKVKYEAAGRSAMPAVGDWVTLRPTTAEGARPQIRAVLPRRSTFSRRAPGRETEEQIVAANIDTIFLVSGLDQDFNPRRIERYLVMARASGAQPVIVLNKADLTESLEADLSLVAELAPGVPVHAVTAKGEETDVSALRAYLGNGQTVALLGSSGVGKSTIINALTGTGALKTGEVREIDGRGRHTTVHRQLIVLEGGGLVIDTPGMRELQLWEEGDRLDMAFPEIDALAGVCRFRDCQHDREPGCAVKVAVADGTIDATRYESYLKLMTERKQLIESQEVRSQIEQKRHARIGSKAMKALKKERGR